MKKRILPFNVLLFACCSTITSSFLNAAAAPDSVWNTMNSAGTYTSAEFFDASRWTSGTRTDGRYYFAYGSAAAITGDFTSASPFYLGYAASDASKVLNSNAGTGSLVIHGNASFSTLGIGIQWGNCNSAGAGNLTVNGSLNVTGSLEVGRNGTSSLKVGTENAGESVTIGTAAAPVNIRFSSQASSGTECVAVPVQVDFRSAENVTIYADRFLIGATASGLAEPFSGPSSSYSFHTSANVYLGMNNTLSANYLILASSYGTGLTKGHSTLEFGEGVNDVSIANEMVVGGLKADKITSEAADAVNVVSVRSGGTFRLHGADGETSKTALSIAKCTCDTSNISYGTLDLRGASSAKLTLSTLSIGYKTETDTTTNVRYGGAEGFLYLGNNTELTADKILMAYKANEKINTEKYTKGTISLGGKSSVTADRLELGNDNHAYIISESNIRMDGGSFDVQHGATFFGAVNVTVGSDSAGNGGVMNIYSDRGLYAAQNGGTVQADLENTAILASCKAVINITGKGQKNVYGDIVCVKENSSLNGYPGGRMEIDVTDEGQFNIYGNFYGGYDMELNLSGSSLTSLAGTSYFRSRNITILDENGVIQTGPTNGRVVKNVSENAVYHVGDDVYMRGNSEITVSGNAQFLIDGKIDVNSRYEAVTYKYNPNTNDFEVTSDTFSNGNSIFNVLGGTVDVGDVNAAGTFTAEFSGGKTYINTIHSSFNNAADTQSLTVSGGEVWLKSVDYTLPTFPADGMTAPEIRFTGGDLSVLEVGSPEAPFSLEQIQADGKNAVLHIGDSMETESGAVTSAAKYGTTNIYGNYILAGGTAELDLNGLTRDMLTVFGSMAVSDASLKMNVGTDGIAFDGSFTQDGTMYEYVTLLAAGTFADITDLPDLNGRVVSTLDFSYLWPESFTEGWLYFIYSNGTGYELEAAKITEYVIPEPASFLLLFTGLILIFVRKRFLRNSCRFTRDTVKKRFTAGNGMNFTRKPRDFPFFQEN